MFNLERDFLSERFGDIDDLHRYLVGKQTADDKENRIVSSDDIVAVNMLLQATGFEGSIVPMSKNVHPSKTLGSVLVPLKNAVSTLEKSDKNASKLKDRLRAFEDERDRLRDDLSRAQAKLEAKERKIVDAENKIRESEQNSLATASLLKKEITELRNVKSSLLKKEQQIRLDMRKKAAEQDKLRERLRVLTSGKEKRIRPTHRVAPERPNRKDSSQGSIDALLSSFKEKEDELITENEALRAALAHYDQILTEFVEEGDSVSSVAHLFELPYDFVKEEIDREVGLKLEKIRQWRQNRN